MSTTSMTLPLDNGFLRRECPACGRQFKWHHGPTEDRPTDALDPSMYFCPYCGESAPPDQWWTQDQIDYARGLATPEAMRLVRDEFRELEESVRGSFLTIKVGSAEAVVFPAPLHEPHDMLMVLSPCHAWEPIKVAEAWTERLHCLVCGSQFAT